MKAVIFSLFRKLVSLFRKLIRKLWLLPPCKKIGYVSQKAWKGSKPPEYHFLPYVTSVLRVVGWIVLVFGVIGSIVWGITTGGIEGGLLTVIGIIGSFLAWLFLLANRELIYLFIHVKENTRSTAERITKEPD